MKRLSIAPKAGSRRDEKEPNEDRLYSVLDSAVPDATRRQKNNSRSWKYGYNSRYDIVVISKDGTLGQVYEINGLKIGLPEYNPEKHISRSSTRKDQYWERSDLIDSLKKIKNEKQWNARSQAFRQKWTPYIDTEFDRREDGVFFMNNGDPTYITGVHYFYMQWCRIDGQYPGFREANRVLFIYWEACKADERCYGMLYVKIRRSGFSYMSAADLLEAATLASDSDLGILSKTGPDAKKLFTGKLVPMNSKLPFFFKPIQDGMDKPKTELVYRVPAKKISHKNMYDVSEDDEEEDGLNTTISWLATDSNAYDGYKLLRLVHDESGKWSKPNNLEDNWDVTKTCLRLGSKIIGKCMMGSTCNSYEKGGKEFQDLYHDSDPMERNDNGQTTSGLYRLFIPMEWNYEGHIDRYGMPVMYDPSPGERIYDDKGARITRGAIPVWQSEIDALAHKPVKQNELYRQYPRSIAHAFRDDATDSIYNLTKIYDQVDHNDSTLITKGLTRARLEWINNKRLTKVRLVPDPRGRFLFGWIPPESMRNNIIERNGRFYPGNKGLGALGVDSYDISKTVDKNNFSKGAISGVTSANLSGVVPDEEFFVEYAARPSTAEDFYEDVIMLMWFTGMPGLLENNKPRVLYHIKDSNMRPFSLNRPDKTFKQLSPSEKELGGIPSNSQAVIDDHANLIESYIDRKVGYDVDGLYRPAHKIGSMPFNKTLHDWGRFNILNRTKFDLSISSGYALMAIRPSARSGKDRSSKISINFAGN